MPRSRDSKSCEPCAKDRLAPGACSPASGARCALWRELLALGPRRGRRPGACATTISQQPPDRSSAKAYLTLPPIFETRPITEEVPPDQRGLEPHTPKYVPTSNTENPAVEFDTP